MMMMMMMTMMITMTMKKIFIETHLQVDHVHKARTVVRSGGLNFDWDERFQLDLLNNMEVVVVISIYQHHPH